MVKYFDKTRAERNTGTVNINLTTGQSIQCAEGQSVLDALKQSEIFLIASCGGKGTCGKCKVRLTQGDAEMAGAAKLTDDEQASGVALACMCKPKGDIKAHWDTTTNEGG